MNNHNYVAIMAGGIGSRFWPMSRTSYPKQFLDILHTGRTLIQQTFDRYIKIPAKGITKNLKLDTYIFSDMGFIAYQASGKANLGSFRADAGIGSALTVKFSPLDIKPLVFRFDMPVFLNTPPAMSDYLKFRYVIGVQRAF